MERITVIVLTYNHENFIDKALNSILEQETCYSFKILIGDDCSPDGTAKKLREYEQKHSDKIEIILREKNIGVRENFLDLLSRAKGEYIALLEGDDYWEDKKKLEKIVNFLDDNIKYIGAFHNVNVVDVNNNYKLENFLDDNPKFSDINSLEEYYEGKLIVTLSLVFRNIFLQKKHLDNYKTMLFDIKYICDYNLKTYLLSLGKIKYFEDIFGSYRHVEDKGTSWSAQKQIIKDEDLIKIYKKNIEMFGEKAERYLALSYLRLFLQTNFYYLKNREICKLVSNLKKFRYQILLKKTIYNRIANKIKRKRV